MNKEDIKKALEYCTRSEGIEGCEKCPYSSIYGCNDTLCKDTLDLITVQEKEIERLKAENNVWSTQINQAYDNGYKDGYDSAQDDIKQAKIDVLNKLKRQAEHCDQWNCEVVPTKYLDEMIEELQK